MNKKQLVIASRESALAMWQARYVQHELQQLYPDMTIQIKGISTRGDQILDKTLTKIGGKGLFIKELEQALWCGEADIAVHSMKDIPMQLPEGFVLAAVTVRANPLDALVSGCYDSLAALPPAAVVGTSSLRREAQIRAAHPHLQVRPLRGNVQTRLNKLDQGQYDAIILAAAGLERLNLASRIKMILPPTDMLPAAGQGALGIEVLAARTDLYELLQPLNDVITAACVQAERSLAGALGGSCQVPLAAFCQAEATLLTLRGLVASPDGQIMLTAQAQAQAQAQAPVQYADALGRVVARQLADQGAGEIIAAVLAAVE